MESIQLRQIAQALRTDCPADCAISNIVTDTSQVTPGALFVAIKGERFDGHDFAPKAEELGAAAVLGERPLPVGIPVLQVASTRSALIELARWYRGLFHTFVVGVTGSVGKTSTKDMICSVLQMSGRTLKTMGNLNNGIGLPKTIFRLDSSYKNAVIEMGMSHAGEISLLTRAARPSVGVITNIGVSHIENLGSKENILKAKLEITEGMSSTAPLVLNADDKLLAEVYNQLERDIIYYGIDSSTADVQAVNIREQDGCTIFGIRFYGKMVTAMIPVLGRHNVYNALAAFSVGLAAGMSPDDIVEGLRTYAPSAMRQNIIRLPNGITVIADCYNASPDSMKASLSVLDGFRKAKRRVAVLGAMLELGSFAEEMHRKVGRYVARNQIDALFVIGEHAGAMEESALASRHLLTRRFETREEMASYLRVWLRPGDAVLYKASRGMRLEEVIEAVHGIKLEH